MSTRAQPDGVNDTVETTALLHAAAWRGEERSTDTAADLTKSRGSDRNNFAVPGPPENTGACRACAYMTVLLAAVSLSAAVFYFTGLTQCWMLLGGADPAAWWNDAIENQDLGPNSGPQVANCSVCISAAPLVFQGCPFDEIGFYVLSGFAAAVPNFILCVLLVALCAARGRLAEVGRRPFKRIWGGLSPPRCRQ